MYHYRTKMYINHTMLSQGEVTLLEVFLDLKKHYFIELTKVTKLTRPRTLRVLRKIVTQNLLEVKAEANVKYYSLKKTPLVYSTMGLIEYNRASFFLSKNTKLKRAIEMFKEKYDHYLIMLMFGSVIKGYATEDSDIDILLLKENFSRSDIKKGEDIFSLINGRTGLKISPYFMKLNEFKKKNTLAKEVINNHILIDGGELFYRLVLE